MQCPHSCAGSEIHPNEMQRQNNIHLNVGLAAVAHQNKIALRKVLRNTGVLILSRGTHAVLTLRNRCSVSILCVRLENRAVVCVTERQLIARRWMLPGGNSSRSKNSCNMGYSWQGELLR